MRDVADTPEVAWRHAVLKSGGQLGLTLDDARGLVAQEWELSAQLRPGTFVTEVVALLDEFVELRPGEETAVLVSAPFVPPNANVREIAATLTVEAAAAAGDPERTDVTVVTGSGANAPRQDFSVEVAASNLPRNIQVRLGEGEVFWTHGGTLQAGDHPLEGFAPQVNAYLDQVQTRPGGQTTFQFLVASESAGRVRIAIDRTPLDYSILQTETWRNPLDDSLRIDRNLQLAFGAQERIELTMPSSTSNTAMSLARIMLDLSGDVGPERLLGDVPVHAGGQFATVSPDYSVAQGIHLSSGDEEADHGLKPGTVVQAGGISGFLRVDADCEIYIEIQPDAGGAPAAEAPLAKLNLALAPTGAPSAPSWVHAAFETPAGLEVDRTHWVVIRGIRGRLRIGLLPSGRDYLSQVRVNRGGRLWRSIGSTSTDEPLVLMLRLVYLPEPDNQTGAIELGLEGLPALLRPDPGPEVQRLTLEAGATTSATALTVTSHARGTVTLANVIQEFAAPGKATA